VGNSKEYEKKMPIGVEQEKLLPTMYNKNSAEWCFIKGFWYIYNVAKSFDLALRKNKIKQNAKVLACGLSERTSLIYSPTFVIRNVGNKQQHEHK